MGEIDLYRYDKYFVEFGYLAMTFESVLDDQRFVIDLEQFIQCAIIVLTAQAKLKFQEQRIRRANYQPLMPG